MRSEKTPFRGTRRCVFKRMSILRPVVIDKGEKYVKDPYMDNPNRSTRFFHTDSNGLFAISRSPAGGVDIREAFLFPEKCGTLLHRIDGNDDAIHRVLELSGKYPLLKIITVVDSILVDEVPHKEVNFMLQPTKGKRVRATRHDYLNPIHLPDFTGNLGMFG